MTIEEDGITIVQGTIIVAAPILFQRTVMLWQGILAGGTAKTQAWIAFSTDPLTIAAVIACVFVMFTFWTFVLVSKDTNSD